MGYHMDPRIIIGKEEIMKDIEAKHKQLPRTFFQIKELLVFPFEQIQNFPVNQPL